VIGALELAVTRATIPDVVTFVASAAVVIAGAVGVVLSRNPVHAALSLVMTLLGIAVLFIEQDADFIAAVQVIVYAGAIVVLFLFVIMFLGVDRPEDLRSEPLKGQRPLAIGIVIVALAGILALAATAHWVTGAHTVVGPISTPQRNNVAQIGVQLFTRYLYAFEATAALLVIAVIGAVVLVRRSRGETPPPEQPAGEVAPEVDDRSMNPDVGAAPQPVTADASLEQPEPEEVRA
jgi:NADH-quinone oxidoreductase subunit J